MFARLLACLSVRLSVYPSVCPVRVRNLKTEKNIEKSPFV